MKSRKSFIVKDEEKSGTWEMAINIIDAARRKLSEKHLNDLRDALLFEDEETGKALLTKAKSMMCEMWHDDQVEATEEIIQKILMRITWTKRGETHTKHLGIL